MNEITIYNTLSPVEKTELQTIAEEIHFLSKKTAEITFRIGEGLARARDIFRHKEGGFQEWIETEFKESRSKAYQYINFYEKCQKESLSVQNSGHLGKFEGISQSNLFLLTSPSTPESVIEEVIERKEAGETPTEASIKEIAEAHKEIKRLKAENEYLKATPEEVTFPLIPEIENLLNKGQIMPAKAKIIQDMTPSNQKVWLSEFIGKFSLENQLNEERRSAQKANEKALKAIEEKESAIAKLSEVTNNPDTAQIIANHEIDLKNMRAEYKRKLEEERNQMAQEASKLHARLNKEKIEKAEKEKALAEKREQEAKSKASAAWKHNDELTRENKKLQSQFEVDKPENLDNAQAKEMQRILQQLPYYFERIKTDNRIANGQMENTKKVIIEIIQSWSSLLEEMDSNETIEHIDKVTAIDIN